MPAVYNTHSDAITGSARSCFMSYYEDFHDRSQNEFEEIYITLLRSLTNSALKAKRIEGTESVGISESMDNLLGHHSANPEKREIFRRTYVPAGSKHTRLSCFDFNAASYSMNDSFMNMCDVLKSWGRVAIEISEARRQEKTAHTDKMSLMHKARYVITGSKGVGKTYCLNAMLSVGASAMLTRKVIWVRVDLTKPSKPWSIRNRIEHQTLLILRNYYLEKDAELKEKFDAYRREKSPDPVTFERQTQYMNNLSGIDIIDQRNTKQETDFSDEDIERLEASKPESSIFVNAETFFIDSGYSFIYILDGLDKVHPTTHDSKRFKEWSSDAAAILALDQNHFNGVIVLCMRTESFDNFAAGTQLRQNARKMHIVPVSPIKIINARIANINLFNLQLEPDVAKKIVQATSRFIGFALGEKHCKGDREYDEVLKLIQEWFKGDTRTLLRVFCQIQKYLLGIKEEELRMEMLGSKSALNKNLIKFFMSNPVVYLKEKSYRFWDVIATGQMKYIFPRFKYSLNGEDIKVILNPIWDREVCGHMINLFERIFDHDSPDNSFQNAGVFHRVAILSYLADREKIGGFSESLGNMKSMMRKLGFASELTKTHLNVMSYHGLIEYTGNEGADISITTAGKRMLNHNGVTPPYVMHAMMNVVFDERDIGAFRMEREILKRSGAGYIALRLDNLLRFEAYLLMVFTGLTKQGKKLISPFLYTLIKNTFESINKISTAAYTKVGQRSMAIAMNKVFERDGNQIKPDDFDRWLKQILIA